MPTNLFPNLALVELRANVLGQGVENTFYVLNSTAWTVSSLTALGSAVISYVNTSTNLAFFSNGTTFTEVVLTDLTTATSPRVTVPFTSGVVGTNPGTALPNNVTWSVKRESAARGRSYRGRVYEFGMTDAQLTNPNVVSGTHVTNWLGYLNGLSAVLSSGGMHEVVYSPTLGVTTDVTQYVQADNTLDAQRRRLPGRGR